MKFCRAQFEYVQGLGYSQILRLSTKSGYFPVFLEPFSIAAKLYASIGCSIIAFNLSVYRIDKEPLRFEKFPHFREPWPPNKNLTEYNWK